VTRPSVCCVAIVNGTPNLSPQQLAALVSETRAASWWSIPTGDASEAYSTSTSGNVTNRNAAPIASMTAAANKSSAPVVVAPTNIASNGGSGGSMTFVPVPVRPKNVEPTFRAIQTINEV
jgi:hypothetical protein